MPIDKDVANREAVVFGCDAILDEIRAAKDSMNDIHATQASITSLGERIAAILNSIEKERLDDMPATKEQQRNELHKTIYASNAGKSGGEFFTPQEVGELLARIAIGNRTSVNKVYDPCCGSGGLLLKFAKILGAGNVRSGFFGQEINLTTYNLARINMFLHDINFDRFNLAREDTLKAPAHWDDEPFDAIVSNPPCIVKVINCLNCKQLAA